MTIAFCSQADLERALGGASVLAQLADPNRTGTPDPLIISDFLETGASEIRTATEVRYSAETLAALDANSARRLGDANAALSARSAYEKGALGLAMPEWVRDRAERTDRFLDQLVKGERLLGRVSGGKTAALSPPVGTVDFDSVGTSEVGDQPAALTSNGAASGISIASFRLGFR